MIPADYLTKIDFELKPDTKSFLNNVMMGLLNIVDINNMDSHNCKFLGNNDAVVFRGTNITVVSFSRSRHLHQPLFAEFPLDQIIPDESSIKSEKAEYFTNPALSLHYVYQTFEDPVTIAFPTSYLSKNEEEIKKAQSEVTQLLIQPTEDDIEKANKIVRVNPIFNGRNFHLIDNLCFVLMSFKSPYTEIYDKIIKPTVEGEGFTCLKSDDIFSTSSVIEDIWANINKASLIIAEISENNPNVMYELGICHTVGKNVMMITQHPENMPFNFRHLRSYPYVNDITNADELKKNISSMIQHIKSTRKS